MSVIEVPTHHSEDTAPVPRRSGRRRLYQSSEDEPVGEGVSRRYNIIGDGPECTAVLIRPLQNSISEPPALPQRKRANALVHRQVQCRQAHFVRVNRCSASAQYNCWVKRQ